MLGEGTQTVNSENAFTKTTPISFIFYLLPHSGPTWEFELCLNSCRFSTCKLGHEVVLLSDRFFFHLQLRRLETRPPQLKTDF